jgi:two-component system phosphate regulon sensor histidine kinase PhoR
VRLHTPAIIFLRRARAILILAGLVPTVFMIATGIILLATGGARSAAIASAILLLAFCTSVITGIILVSMLVSKGASEARFQQDYLSIVSHELRTPLTSIRLFVETLDSKALDEEDKQQGLALLRQEMARLEDLVERLLDLTRMELGATGFAREPVSIDDVVQDALSVAAASTTLNPAPPIAVDVAPGMMVEGDHTALVRALSNLLTNAWKYTPAGDKRIALRVRAAGRKQVEIAVADNGPGLAPGEQHRIFDPFQRGSAASKTAGSGLGLAIVRAIVRAHRGRVEVHSEPGRGTEFRIRLRRLPADR